MTFRSVQDLRIVELSEYLLLTSLHEDHLLCMSLCVNTCVHICVCVCVLLGIEPRASSALRKYSTTELELGPCSTHIFVFLELKERPPLSSVIFLIEFWNLELI